MSPSELEQRKLIVETLRLVATDSAGLTGRIDQATANVLMGMLDEAKFVAEGLLGGDPYYVTSVEQEYAQGIIDAVGNAPLPETDEDDYRQVSPEEAYEQGLIDGADELIERMYGPTESSLEHVEANDYRLKPEYDSVWIGIDSIAVYVRRMNGQVVVELCPNNDEAAATVYDSCSAYLEPEEGAE